MSNRSPATAPTRAPIASLFAALIAIALVALGVVAVRDLAVAQGWTTGSPWATPVVESLDGLTAGTPVVVAGVVAGVLALVLLYVALKPARRTHAKGADSATDLWVTPAAVAALAREAADRTSGVQAAEARATRRKVSVSVSVDPSASGVAEAVQQSVSDQLSGLATQSVRVRTRTQEQPS